jgi:hypothetical protein
MVVPFIVEHSTVSLFSVDLTSDSDEEIDELLMYGREYNNPVTGWVIHNIGGFIEVATRRIASNLSSVSTAPY